MHTFFRTASKGLFSEKNSKLKKNGGKYPAHSLLTSRRCLRGRMFNIFTGRYIDAGSDPGMKTTAPTTGAKVAALRN
jgi:hypothetical protein